MTLLIFLLAVTQQSPAEPSQIMTSEQRVVQKIAESGRCADLAESPQQRVAPASAIAPGPPPLLSFRYYEGQQHRRFGNSDLILDDAGH